MIKWLLLALVLFGTGPKEIAKINRLKKEAQEAFERLDFETAAARYTYLKDSIGLEDPEIALNLAHSYYQLADTASAKDIYGELSMRAPAKAKSIALQQLGVMAKSPNTLEQSLQYLKSSLKADPTNKDARYDYEVVKKLIEQQKENQQNQDQNKDNQDQEQEQEEKENQDQQNQDQQQNQENGEQQEQEQQEQQPQESEEQQEGEEQKPEEQKPQEGEESEEEKQQSQEQSVKDKLEEMNISEEKARMILEALRNNEIQYIQQQKRKAKKRPDSGRPDW